MDWDCTGSVNISSVKEEPHTNKNAFFERAETHQAGAQCGLFPGRFCLRLCLLVALRQRAGRSWLSRTFPTSGCELSFQVCNPLVLLFQPHLPQLGLQQPVFLLLLQPGDLLQALLHLQESRGDGPTLSMGENRRLGREEELYNSYLTTFSY